MRRNNNRSSSQNGGGYNNQHRRGRHHSGGQGGGNRPRRNYGAAREKYLAQARDALSSGDRVLAENYYQHAEHCYRMMVEEGGVPRQNTAQNHYNGGNNNDNDGDGDALGKGQSSALPAFITSTAHPSMQEEMGKEPVPAQNWEERDEA